MGPADPRRSSPDAPERPAGSPARPPDVGIRWIPSSGRASAQDIWRALERRVPAAGLACSWDWTGTWLAHFGDVVPHRFAVGEVRGAPVGIALVARGRGQRRGPIPVRTIHLGTAGEAPGTGVFVEYNRILVEPDARSGFAAALLSELRREVGWDELLLDGFAPEDAEPFLQPPGRFRVRSARCPTTDLRLANGTDGDVLRTLRSSTRRKVRRGLRGLGPVTTEWAETADHAIEILDELVVLHQERWRRSGEPGAFATERLVAFHRQLVRVLIPRQAVLLFRVRASGATVGCLYHFIEQGSVLFYQSGLARYPDAEIRPGFVAFGLCMQECFERGLREYNFLAGEARYKRELATGDRTLVWATWRRPTIRGSIIRAASRLRAWTGRSGPATEA